MRDAMNRPTIDRRQMPFIFLPSLPLFTDLTLFLSAAFGHKLKIPEKKADYSGVISIDCQIKLLRLILSKNKAQAHACALFFHISFFSLAIATN